LALIALLAFIPATVALAQSIISAVGGLVHFAEGPVLVAEKVIEFDPARALHAKKGERIRTEDGRAEVMLVPDGFLRMAPNSESEMVSVGVDSARARLHRGSAIVELNNVWDQESVSLECGETTIHFRKAGLYRIDAQPGEPFAFKVLRGKATVETPNGERDVKGKQSVTVSEDNSLAVAKLNKTEKDSLDEWSEKREQLLAEARREAEASGHGQEGQADDILVREGSPMWRCRQVGFGCGPTADRTPTTSGPGPQAPAPQPGGGGRQPGR
jgi:hypothetical protein